VRLKGVYIEIVSIIWMIIEAVVAIRAGLIAHSLSLFAFGIDSVVELIAAFVLLWRLWIEIKNHSIEKVEKAEKTASWIVGIILLLLAGYIVISAIFNLYLHNSAESSFTGIVIAIIAGILMPFISWSKIKIGTAINSPALKADGYCSLVCAYMSWVLLIGVVFTAIFGWWWIDSVISLLLVYFIVKEGIEVLKEAKGEKCSCDCH
jgi:divalent metal cation (Fe/Co/Zn/Cd) transporter